MFIKVGSARKVAVPTSLSKAHLYLSPCNLCLPPHIHSYNGCLSSGDKGRRRSRLALNRRPHANGVKPDVMHHISTPLVSKASSLSQQTRAAVLPLLPHPTGARELTVSFLIASWAAREMVLMGEPLQGAQSFPVCKTFPSPPDATHWAVSSSIYLFI